jgi:chaperonin GroES
MGRLTMNRIVVRRLQAMGGIIIADAAKKKPQEGDIVALGLGVRGEAGMLQPLDVKTGARVLFGE